MTVSTTISRINYTGDGAQTVFTYPFPITADSDMEVYLDDVLQVAGYSVTGAGGASGTVVFGTAPASGAVVTLYRNMPATQLADFLDYSSYPASTINGAFDRTILVVQQAVDYFNRAIVAAVSDDGSTDFHLPAYDAGKGLKWDTALQALTNTTYDPDSLVDPATINGWGAPIDSRFTVDDTGAANAIAFTPTPAPLVTDSLTARRFFIITPIADNTGPTTVATGVIPGTKALKKVDGTGKVDLVAGDIIALNPFIALYDGVDYVKSNNFNQAAVAITGGTVAGVTLSSSTLSSSTITSPTFSDSTNIIQTIYTANGTHTFDTRTKHFNVEVVGGGGSGAKSTGGGASPSSGGAGGYSAGLYTKVAATATIVTGAGGAGTAVDPGNGNAGGTSSFTDGTNTLTSTGGSGGLAVSTGYVAGGTGAGSLNDFSGEPGSGNDFSGTSAYLSNAASTAHGSGSPVIGTGGSGTTNNGGGGRVIITEYVI